jgi:uncharacterized protein
MGAAQNVKARSAIWQRLDIPGMDSCRVLANPEGWKIEGTAIFAERGQTAALSYDIECDHDWSTRAAHVRGSVGGRDILVELQRTPGRGWTNNDQPLEKVAGLLDVDLGFTPASNTNALRRLDLQIGQEVETTAVWLDTTDWTVKPLTQFYMRLSSNVYKYRSPIHDYEAELEVDNIGIVINYPNLWKALPPD